MSHVKQMIFVCVYVFILRRLCVFLQLPTLGFLYIAGYIGYVGRSYIIAKKGEKKPTEAEIIIDVPLALELSFKGAGWPFAVFTELKRGTLTESDANITVSPR